MKKLAAFEYIDDTSDTHVVAVAAARAAMGVLVQASAEKLGTTKLGDVILVAPAGASANDFNTNLLGLIGGGSGRHAVVVFATVEPREDDGDV